MRNQIVSVGIIGFLLLILCSGCTQNSGFGSGNTTAQLLGSWKDRDTSYLTFMFSSNGSCLINGDMQGAYELKNKTLTIIYPNKDINTFDLFISTNGQLLKLTNTIDGYVRLYDKQ